METKIPAFTFSNEPDRGAFQDGKDIVLVAGGTEVLRMEGQLDKITGKKHDGGKPPMALLSGAALTEVAKVLEFGAKKYDSWNWKGGFAWSRLASAVLRHIFAWLSGEDKDPETGLSHLAHASCGLMFLLDFEVNKIGTDDRYKPNGK